MKEYIRDNGEIRKCDSNIAKMSVLEYIRYFVKWRCWFPVCRPNKNDFKGILQILMFFLQIIPFFIIPSLLYARKRIKKAKVKVEKINNNKKVTFDNSPQEVELKIINNENK